MKQIDLKVKLKSTCFKNNQKHINIVQLKIKEKNPQHMRKYMNWGKQKTR